MAETKSFGIPVHFVGPNGEELSLGEYVAVRKDFFECLESIRTMANNLVSVLEKPQQGIGPADEMLGIRLKLRAELASATELSRPPAKIEAK